MPVFTDLVNKGRKTMQSPGLVDSRDWFREKAQLVRQVNTNTLINAHKEYNRNMVLPGFMYCFSYDAKYKDVLPYYDRFPLIFPFKDDGDSFLGMNMHYLPLMYRARLMDALYNVASNQKFDDKTRLRISYNLLNSSAKYKYFEPCVKRYLKSHVKSRFLLIPSNEWDIALFLPMERFTVNKNKVFQDSMNMIRKG